MLERQQAGAMSHATASSRDFVYGLDASDRLAFVSDAWLRFARENGAPELTRDRVLERPVWEFVSGESTRQLYELVYEAVRMGRREVTLPLRCDSPDRRRFMELQLAPDPYDGVRLCARLLREEPRAAVPLFDAAVSRSQQALPTCCWCLRIRGADHHWIDVEEAIRGGDLLGEGAPPRLEHVACETCEERVVFALRRVGSR